MRILVFDMLKIAVLEDDLDLLNDICYQFKRNQFIAEAFTTGESLIKNLLDNSYDCIILDVNLPDTNGFDLCKTIKASNPDTGVILLTALNQLTDKVSGFESGADDYLTKPFYFKELFMRVNNILKLKHLITSTTSRIEYKELVLNLDLKQVERAGKKIDLTPKEFQILLYLVRHPEKVISKKELIKQLWGNAVQVNNNTIEVFINSLRSKVDKDFEYKLILTKVGYGYYLSQ